MGCCLLWHFIITVVFILESKVVSCFEIKTVIKYEWILFWSQNSHQVWVNYWMEKRPLFHVNNQHCIVIKEKISGYHFSRLMKPHIRLQWRVFIDNIPKNVSSLLLDTEFPSLWLIFDFSDSWIHPLSTLSPSLFKKQFLIDSSLRW